MPEEKYDSHEFVVLKTDLDPADLPTDELDAVSEDENGAALRIGSEARHCSSSEFLLARFRACGSVGVV